MSEKANASDKHQRLLSKKVTETVGLTVGKLPATHVFLFSTAKPPSMKVDIVLLGFARKELRLRDRVYKSRLKVMIRQKYGVYRMLFVVEVEY